MNKDVYFMGKALLLAKKAGKKGEVPIGAIVVKNGKIISKAYNCREKRQNATYHAEIIAISKACKKLRSWRLDDCEMYCTLEPCVMCAGAIVNARIKRVIFGACEPKSGAISSKFHVLSESGLNHVTEYFGEVLQEECSKLLKDFFSNLRKV